MQNLEPKFKDIMLDLKTLASESKAVVVSIGACYFSKDEIGPYYYRVLNLEEQLQRGRVQSDDTLLWWKEQSDEAREVFTKFRWPVFERLHEFNNFYNEGTRLWGNGSDFDCVILRSLFDTYELKPRWSFRDHRCFRTLKEIAFMSDSHLPKPDRIGIHHNALDDAIHQAKCAQRYLKGRLKWA